MKRFVCLAPLVTLLCVSCTDRDTRLTDPTENQTPDLVYEERGITTAFYDSDNPTTHRRLTEAHDVLSVGVHLDHFERVGYACDPNNAFFIEGVEEDGEQVAITVLVLTKPADAVREAVYLFYIQGRTHTGVVPVRIWLDDVRPEGRSYEIEDGAWCQLAESPLATSCVAVPGFSVWFRCVAERIAAGAASCAVVCRFAAPVYLRCLAVCTAGHAVYAMVHCTIQQL